MRSAFLLAICAAGVLAACFAAQGPMPGDVAVTQAVQSLLGAAPAWAAAMTETAKPPMVAATILLGTLLAWVAARWRSAAAVPLAFGLSWLFDKALRATIVAPRPGPELVEVASASSSSGLPSTFGLVYGSVFGVILFVRPQGRLTTALRALAVFLIVAGSAARIVLGGHWTSQMVGSVLLGLLAALAAHIVVRQLGPGYPSDDGSPPLESRRR